MATLTSHVVPLFRVICALPALLMAAAISYFTALCGQTQILVQYALLVCSSCLYTTIIGFPALPVVAKYTDL